LYPTVTYVFDVCADVTGINKPTVCDGVTGPALQFDPSQANPTVCYGMTRCVPVLYLPWWLAG